MLTAVTRHRPALVAGFLIVAGILAGCADTVNGAGKVAAGSARPASSTPDFPTTGPTTGPTTPAPELTAPPSAPSGPPSTPPSSPPARGIHPAPSTPLRTATVKAASGASYLVKVWADVKNSTCFDHAWGTPMITFLTQHPCGGLERYLATTTVNGRPVGFAEATTSFPGTASDPYRYSRAFAELEKADGTGSIDDLLREGYRLPSGPAKVPSSQAFNVVGQDNGVTVWDIWYLDGPTPPDDEALIAMTQDLFLQF
jgi:predicted small secreted protein